MRLWPLNCFILMIVLIVSDFDRSLYRTCSYCPRLTVAFSKG